MKLSKLLQTTDIPVTINSNLREQVFQKDLKIKLEKNSYVDATVNNDLLFEIKEQVKINKKDACNVNPHMVVIEGFEKINPIFQLELINNLTDMAKNENIKTVLPFDSGYSLLPALKARTINYTQEMAQVYDTENDIKNMRSEWVENIGTKKNI